MKFNPKDFDFGGYATRNDIECADGRVIRKNAFLSQDGMKVPLVWQHQRNDPTNVIGHAYLENRNDGVYAWCKFNESKKGQHVKLVVEHGDVDALSIFANRLQQEGNNVTHGMIREVSVVLAGANPGAIIDNPLIQHSDDDEDAYYDMTRGIIYMDAGIELMHSDDEDDEPKKTQKQSVKMKGKKPVDDDDEDEDDDDIDDDDEDDDDDKKAQHADTEDDDDETVQDVYNSMNEKQKKVVAYMIGAALAEAEGDDEDEDENAEHSAMEGDDTMKKSVFDQNNKTPERTLTHDELTAIMEDAKKCGSLKEAFLSHTQNYGIENIDILFPDAKTLANEPYMIKRDTEWVAGVLSETNHVPFSRVKSVCADITADEARARGYVKGSLKKDEVIRLLKRVTTPTTIYKKQKLDRDDVIDITDLNIVAWLKAEMRVMLNEELARAFLIGDGRAADSTDKINEENIRPIWKDDDMYAHHVAIPADHTPDMVVEDVIRSRKFYKGSGTPTLYTTTDMLTDMLLVKDKIGRRIYNTETELASALRVRKIVEVPVMDGQKREDDDENELTLLGIIVNLRDYTVGATQGGQVSMFDDFDIDYNQYKYLIETRCSGALTMPKSALVLERLPEEDEPVTPPPSNPPEIG